MKSGHCKAVTFQTEYLGNSIGETACDLLANAGCQRGGGGR